MTGDPIVTWGADVEAILRGERKRKKTQPLTRFPKDVAQKRQAAQSKRQGRALSRATQAHRAMHPEEWNALYAAARAEVDRQEGPLPGDELRLVLEEE